MNKIDPEKYYSLHEILKLNFFTWIGSMQTLSKWVDYDREHDNILKARISGTDTGTRYLIQGKDIITFIANFEDGSLHMVNPEGGDIHE
jgi:hypothetical protein